MAETKINAVQIEIAVANHFNWRQNIIIPNLSHSMLLYEADEDRI